MILKVEYAALPKVDGSHGHTLVYALQLVEAEPNSGAGLIRVAWRNRSKPSPAILMSVNTDLGHDGDLALRHAGVASALDEGRILVENRMKHKEKRAAPIQVATPNGLHLVHAPLPATVAQSLESVHILAGNNRIWIRSYAIRSHAHIGAVGVIMVLAVPPVEKEQSGDPGYVSVDNEEMVYALDISKKHGVAMLENAAIGNGVAGVDAAPEIITYQLAYK